MKHSYLALCLLALFLPYHSNADTVPTSPSFTVYSDGAFNWPGDYSYSARINYQDTSGLPTTGTYDIKVVIQQWGAWQPVATNWNFDVSQYNFLQLDLKPTVANQIWACFATTVGDKKIIDSSGNSVMVDVTKYGPAPQPGVWGTYKIPLADIMLNQGAELASMYKFSIQDQTKLPLNTFYIDNVKFTAK